MMFGSSISFGAVSLEDFFLPEELVTEYNIP
jgi:hypothetical protein